MVDADVHGVETIEAAIHTLQRDGHAVQTEVFSAPDRDQNQKWQKLLQQPGICFRPVPRRRSGEANDQAISQRLTVLAQSATTQRIALLTSDVDFADVVLHIEQLGKPALVLVPQQDRAAIHRFQSIGLAVHVLASRAGAFPKVRAVLLQDGSGHVRLSSARQPYDVSENVEFCERFLKSLGYAEPSRREYLTHASAKFWLVNQLGSLTVYPPSCAINEVCEKASGKPHAAFAECSNPESMALLIPKASVGKKSRAVVEAYGSTEARSVFRGGGPVMLMDSDEMVVQALTHLGYMDDAMNSDLAEALLVFMNAPGNKYALQKQLDVLPVREDVVADVAQAMRGALQSHLTSGHWRLAPKDASIRQLLCREGYLSTEQAAVPDVFHAMATYASKHQLPTMKTYNGYVFRILYSKDPNPDKTGTVEFTL